MLCSLGAGRSNLKTENNKPYYIIYIILCNSVELDLSVCKLYPQLACD